MAIKEKIKNDLKDAIKSKNELKVSVLRMLLSVVQNKEIEKKRGSKNEEESLTEEEMIDSVSSEFKKRKEAIIGFEKGGRNELAEKEKEEMAILKEYLPEQMSEEQIRNEIEEIVRVVGAKNMKDIGKVMAKLMPKVKGKADGNIVNSIVREILE